MLHQANGALCLHASAVATQRGAVVLVGPSTAGKSSLARAWSERAGVGQLADDVAVLYADGAGGYRLHPLCFRTEVRGEIRGDLEQPDLEVDDPGPARPVTALVFVEPVRDGEPELAPLAARALPIVLSESCCFLFADAAARARFYAANLDLLSSVPCRRLFYPRRRDRVGPTVDLLRALAAGLETALGP